jgi:glycosyltransferase involved in cell wall biosynthesis
MGAAEPLGLASMEAQASGSPVIVASDGGLPETIRDGETGWATPREPMAVASRIEALGDARLRGRARAAASAWGATMTWQRSAAALRRVLDEAARRA